jgi:hypothetical protein
MDAIEFRSSVHSHATGPRASEDRVNGSWNPLLGVILRNLTHGRGSATFAPQPPSDGRQMAQGRLKSIGGAPDGRLPFRTQPNFGSRKPGFKLQATDRSAQHLVLLSHVCSCISQTPSIINTDSIGCVIRPAAEVCSGASHACHAAHPCICSQQLVR